MSLNLYDAHRQWVTRPPDERFANLENLHEYVRIRRLKAREEIRPLYDLKLCVNDFDAIGINGSFKPAPMTNWAFGQLCSNVGAPARYLRTLPAHLAGDCLRETLSKSGERCKLLLRTAEGEAEEGNHLLTAAFTGPAYGRIWDADVIESLREAVKDSSWHVPASRSTEPAGLYASDRDMFVFLVCDETPVEVGNAKLGRGFFIWNSETGASTLGLTTFLYNYICGNHIVWGAEEIYELKIVHRNKAIDRFYKEAVPTLNRFVESRTVASTIKDAVENAMTVKIGDSLPDVLKTFESKPFSKREINEAWNQGQAEGEDVSTVWGMVQGLTAYARTFTHIDSRVALERRAGNLLTLT
jgi:hypothetical protein